MGSQQLTIIQVKTNQVKTQRRNHQHNARASSNLFQIHRRFLWQSEGCQEGE